MSRIFWDTNLFIYFLEGNQKFSPLTKELRRKMLMRGDQLLTSTFTMGEVLVKPLEQYDMVLCRQYQDTITKAALLVPFDVRAAWSYADIRRDRSFRAPDAIQLACAASVGVDLFVTNDQRLQGKHVPGVQFITSIDRVPI
ncbi:MAG TPA: PIN domain-containing protein [Terriglobales bacterium]|nr:PIN domain-containing protein [Terriglobales bacterium]